MKTPTPVYSTLISCLHDEPEPVGHLGRGTHYSVFRSIEWLDVIREPLTHPHVHDFAVIWDEDHDTRVIEVVESIYMAGLLSPIQFVGERKGTLTIIVAAKFYYAHDTEVIDAYVAEIAAIASSSSHGDSWPVEIGTFDRAALSDHQTDVNGIIAEDEYRVITYLKNIDILWSLGTRPYVRPAEAKATWPPMPPVPNSFTSSFPPPVA